MTEHGFRELCRYIGWGSCVVAALILVWLGLVAGKGYTPAELDEMILVIKVVGCLSIAIAFAVATIYQSYRLANRLRHGRPAIRIQTLLSSVQNAYCEG